MTDNVVSFAGKKSNLSQWVEKCLEFFNPLELPHTVTDLFRYLSNDDQRVFISDSRSENVNPGYATFDIPSGEKGRSIFLETVLRPRVIPQYGIQSHLNFFNLSFIEFTGETKDHLLGLVASFPNNLNHSLSEYYQSFPECNQDNLTGFCYSAIKYILTDSKFRFISLLDGNQNEAYKDKFGFQVIELPEDNQPVTFYQFEFDYLPILLDNSAMEFWNQKLKG